MITDCEHEAPPPNRCPLCGTPARYFPLHASAMLDWVQVLQEDLATLDNHLTGLKASLESTVPE